MKILFLESFFGGSHKDFALGLRKYSKHEIDIISLAARSWKWRMQGAALEFSRKVRNIEMYDLIFATGMINLSDFKAVAHACSLPGILYFHENQLTYPLAENRSRDVQFGYINISSALTATKVIFNSKFQQNEFIIKVDQLLDTAPDYCPGWITEEIKEKSIVIYPGCDFLYPVEKPSRPENGEHIIIWNHRWEWDKNPDDFFWALGMLKQQNIPFKLVILGESCNVIPGVFKRAEQTFKDEIIRFGYMESKKEYFKLLHQGAIVVSTAIQENFGISIVEAVRMGCIPVLPDRLSYPEIMPEKSLDRILYSDKNELLIKLKDIIINYEQYESLGRELSSWMERYSWHTLIKQYDKEFEQTAGVL